MLSAPQTHLNINIVWLGLDKEWSAECTSSGGYPNINVPTRPDAVGPVPSAGSFNALQLLSRAGLVCVQSLELRSCFCLLWPSYSQSQLGSILIHSRRAGRERELNCRAKKKTCHLLFTTRRGGGWLGVYVHRIE